MIVHNMMIGHEMIQLRLRAPLWTSRKVAKHDTNKCCVIVRPFVTFILFVWLDNLFVCLCLRLVSFDMLLVYGVVGDLVLAAWDSPTVIKPQYDINMLLSRQSCRTGLCGAVRR